MQSQVTKFIIFLLLLPLGSYAGRGRQVIPAPIPEDGLRVSEARCGAFSYNSEKLYQTISTGVQIIIQLDPESRESMEYKPKRREVLPFIGPYYIRLLGFHVDGLSHGMEHSVIFTGDAKLAKVVTAVVPVNEYTTYKRQYTDCALTINPNLASYSGFQKT